MKRRLALLAALCCCATPAAARDDQNWHQLGAGAPVSLRPDRALVMVRVRKSAHAGWIAPTFLRVPAADEIEGYEQLRRAAYAKDGE